MSIHTFKAKIGLQLGDNNIMLNNGIATIHASRKNIVTIKYSNS